MADLIAQIMKLNGLEARTVSEPFAGGAGASLKLLLLEAANRIHINDADPAIFGFWWSLLHQSKDFIRLLESTPVSMAEWRHQRDIYRSNRRMARLAKGFAAFYLNRCNRSGIIADGGPIGGVKQAGKWDISARFNRPNLIEKCTRIVEYRERISVSGYDGLNLIEKSETEQTFFFIDPPYYVKGSSLYMNSLSAKYHRQLAAYLENNPDVAWIMTYDDCAEIRQLYRGWARVRPFGLRYAAARRRSGDELLITPRWMRMPRQQSSLAISW